MMDTFSELLAVYAMDHPPPPKKKKKKKTDSK